MPHHRRLRFTYVYVIIALPREIGECDLLFLGN
jgi:hypothetical protein